MGKDHLQPSKTYKYNETELTQLLDKEELN